MSGINIQVVQITFVYVIVFYDLFHLASIWHRYVSRSHVMNDFIVIYKLTFYSVQHLFKKPLYFGALFFWTVQSYCCHLLIWFNETFVFLFELLYLHSKLKKKIPIVSKKTLKNWWWNTMEFYFILSQALALFRGELPKHRHVWIEMNVITH